ncbi:hypothetical protein FSP39_023252 [Pinctada imbricata]|uniref:Uncharacterized protein n=1 Tax=Pinctada imbricata TaxID=66713 RepID=A0AA88YVV2_PINIB|nr:hypothetical protein FSP39_023252 [Pinctada imbricata]
MPDLLDRFLQWRKLRRLEKPRGLHALPPLTAPGVYIIFQNETDTGKETNYDPKAVTERELERLNYRIVCCFIKIMLNSVTTMAAINDYGLNLVEHQPDLPDLAP